MTSKATGTKPTVGATDDFNNDGFLDVAIVNYDESTTSILLGNGNGGFNEQNKLSNGNNAQTNNIAIGDLNNDNKLDLVVVNSGASNIRIFLGQGDGSFSTQTTLSTGTGSSPLGIAIGDLNKDNKRDIVVSDSTNNRLLIFIGNGNGTFIQTNILSTGTNSRPYSIVMNYFNSDTNLDIVVSNANANNIGVFLGDGTGNFGQQTTYTTGSQPNTLVSADFNRDGILDIATANYLGNSISVLLGNGDGTFREQTTFSTGSGSLPNAIDSGDFDRDNKQDLIVVNSGTNNIDILLGRGNGNFKTQKFYSTGSDSNPNDILIGDFNRDNQLDFISVNSNKNNIGIFINTCSRV